MSERTMKVRRDISLEDAKRLCLEMIRPGEVDGMPSANDAAIRVVLEALAGAEQSLRLATNLTIPLSDHQRLQAEAAAMREALEAAQKGLKDYLVACGRVIPDSWFDHLLEIGLLTQDHPLNYVVERKDGPLSSSAGSALLAEMEEMRKERDEVRATVEILRSEQGTLKADVRHAEAASATLRSRLETVERERDALRQRRFPIQGGPSIPWAMIAPHAGQATINHGQGLERLAERGGLSHREAVGVLEGLPSRDVWRIPEAEGETRLAALVAKWEAESATLRARVETAERERDETLKTVQSNRVLRDSEVRRAVEEAVAKEREEIARVLDLNHQEALASAIRARGGA